MNVFIKTYGCQMNERDSEAIAGMLTQKGCQIVDHESKADVLIFNTCSVREQAERKAIGKVGFMKKLKKDNPALVIGIMGCMAQNHGEELLKTLPHVDFVIGTGQLHKLPEVLNSIMEERNQLALLDEGSDVLTSMGSHYQMPDSKPCQAFIAVTRGCNRFCSYCIVPHVRGREISREIHDVVEEAKELVASGIKEIMLLGQNVAAYGLNGDTKPPPEGHSPFADLLRELNSIDGLERIRFTSPYPSYFNDKLIDAIAELPKVCHNVHLPLQSGSDRILKKMNRQYTAEQYLEIACKMKQRIPDITFSTDVIVGFPGSTEEDFIKTRNIMNNVGFDNAFIFKFSPREGTPAALMEDQVPQEEKERRNQILLQDLEKRTAEHNLKLVGTVQEVLVEGPSRRNADRWSGKTSTAKVVMFPPDSTTERGKLVKVKIARCTAVSLFGELV
ncbi:tRNA (N6-isopentenyl adenosine(37)-C2)-methylthiotransferase MiaB [Lentisphaerota bacterium ZTH]|nr:tRNA (N6-isopentenyl adenosine(37)-C2)-methylthiotransferase MiaB [Lentisphaerota bacterium]WET05105.1 tRNA (N6-isopentenyl adenosine(37)-C2)-methylthiotransferase MiaB [Lentisphaerota bacterium ZTH]